MMDRFTGELVGTKLGTFVETETEDDDTAIGKYMRVKVRILVEKPLLRGVTMEVHEHGKTVWCPLEYEHLPDFCFVCGVLGHGMKICSTKLAVGEKP
jgi:hypothetical protein